MSLASMITGNIGVWVIKGSTALGLGMVTYAGFSALKSQLDTAITGALGSLGSGAYQILALAGFIDAVGIALGAMTAAVTILSMKRFGAMTTGG